MVQVHWASVIMGESQNSWVWFRSSGLRVCGGGKRLGPFCFFYIYFLLFSFEACTFESVVQCLSMIGGESRDCGEGLVVVLEFLAGGC